MAKVVTITKNSITKVQGNIYRISVDAEITEDAVTLLSGTFAVNWDSTTAVSKARQVLSKKIQKAWDKYADEQAKYDNAAYQTLCDNIDGDLTTYLNP